MTIRCGNCHGVAMVQRVVERGGKPKGVCGSCGQTYVLDSWGRNGPGRSLMLRARRLAKQEGIDLPGAYSIAVGIMTLEELRELGEATSTPCRTAKVAGFTTGPFDLAFQPAIDEGFLTERQAAERGDRGAFAAIMASRHKLKKSTSLAVADNRMSLLEAIRQRERKGAAAMHVAAPARKRVGLITWIGVVVVVAAALLVMRDSRIVPNAGSRSETRYGTAGARTDGYGRVTEVRGPDPRSVLRAYCVAATRRGRLEPLEVVPSALPGGRTRLGLLRDPRRPDDLLAITIREDRDSGVWRAGDGRKLLVAEPAPEGAERAIGRH